MNSVNHMDHYIDWSATTSNDSRTTPWPQETLCALMFKQVVLRLASHTVCIYILSILVKSSFNATSTKLASQHFPSKYKSRSKVPISFHIAIEFFPQIWRSLFFWKLSYFPWCVDIGCANENFEQLLKFQMIVNSLPLNCRNFLFEFSFSLSKQPSVSRLCYLTVFDFFVVLWYFASLCNSPVSKLCACRLSKYLS
jgi:hypothetical protein